MKKLLRLLGTMALCGNTSLSIIGCSSPNSDTQAIDLNSIIQNKDLGVITARITPTKTELLKGIKDKNQTASNLTVDDFTIKTTNSEAAEVTITGTGNYTGEVTLKYEKQTVKTNLKDIIRDKVLDSIVMKDSIPDKAELLKGIKDKNLVTANSLTVDDFDFETTSNPNPTATDAIIIGTGNYTGEVTLKYEKQTVKTNLNSIIQDKALGPIVMKDSIPDKTELLKGIQAKNPDIAKDLTVDDFDFETTSNPTATDAIIIGTGNYEGDVPLTYTRETDLTKYLTTTDLKVIKTSTLVKPTANQIKTVLVADGKNLGLDTSAITIENISEDHATISAANIKYIGSVDVSYTVDQAIINLSEVITTPNLGAIKIKNDTPTERQIKDALTSGGKNPGLDTNVITFSSLTAIGVKITGYANAYTGSVDVIYTVEKPIMDQELNDIIGATIKTNTLFFNNDKWYVGCSNGRIYRYDENFTNPQVVADLTTRQSVQSVEEMIFHNDKWYVGCGNGKIYCFDEDFTNQEKVADLGKIIDAITVVNDKCYVGCYDKKIYRFDLDKDGKFTNQEVVLTLNEEPDVIVFNNDKWYVGNNSGQIYRYDEDFTNQIEVADLKANIDTMIFHNDKWYVGCSDGKIYCFDEYFGNKQVFSNLESGQIYSLFEKNNRLYIMTNSKEIFEFNY